MSSTLAAPAVARSLFSLVLLLCLLIPAAAVADTQEHWFSVHLDGRKIGHMHTRRALEAGRVLTDRTLELTLERNGEPLVVRSLERNEEGPAGEPFGFVSETDLAGSRSRSEGRIVDGEVIAHSRQHGQPDSEHRYPWPAGALLAEGQRLATARHALTAGTRFVVDTFDPARQQRQPIEWQVGETAPVQVNGREETAVAVRQTLKSGDGDGMAFDAWLDPVDRAVRRLRVPALGLLLEMHACDRACALAPAQPTDVLAATLVQAPRALGARERRGTLQYRLALGDAEPLTLGNLPGQSVQPDADGRQRLTVDPAGSAVAPPTAADREATRWLQSDDDEIRALATATVLGIEDERARMLALEAAVRRHISNKSLRIGYASALEALRLREGDCTEHALLLAALARAAGIPARVATGLAYTPSFGGRRHVFVPHAWVFAWVDGRWQGFDAAQPRYDSSHIAFSSDHGDPFRFYRGLELLGRMQIDAIDRSRGRR